MRPIAWDTATDREDPQSLLLADQAGGEPVADTGEDAAGPTPAAGSAEVPETAPPTAGARLFEPAYFAQFALDVPSVAMVTASHNENGWTGVKMGAQRPLTFGPDEMDRLKAFVLGGEWAQRPDGSVAHIAGVAER
mgnify:CR=1 FL=1